MSDFGNEELVQIFVDTIYAFEETFQLTITPSSDLLEEGLKELIPYLKNLSISMLKDLYKAVGTIVFFFVSDHLFDISPKNESYPFDKLLAIEIGIDFINSERIKQGKELYQMHDDFKLCFANKLKQSGLLSRECIELIYYGVYESRTIE